MSIGKHGAPGRPHLRTLLNANPVNCCPQHNPNQTEPTLPQPPTVYSEAAYWRFGFWDQLFALGAIVPCGRLGKYENRFKV